MHKTPLTAADSTETSTLLNQAVKVCRGIIRKNISKTGLAASIDNYPQI